jgi:hypothetical protein
MNKNKIQNNTTTQKNFSFSKGEVSLSFNLRIDTKQDLEDFAELLRVALLEVDKEINK